MLTNAALSSPPPTLECFETKPLLQDGRQYKGQWVDNRESLSMVTLKVDSKAYMSRIEFGE